MIKITEPYADVGWTLCADADAEELWVFFDMKDGTKPEGSVLISIVGACCEDLLQLFISDKRHETRCSKELTVGVNTSCKNWHESSCFLLSAQRPVFS